MSATPRRVLVVLQARLSSSRLPAKAMLSVGGRPLVVLAAQRAANTGRKVVVATSDQLDDDVIARAATDAGVSVTRGPLEDPLRRFAIATEELLDGDIVVRLTGDNALPDGTVVDRLVDELHTAGIEYARIGGIDVSLPYGLSAEAFSVSALRAADLSATTSAEREHVTPWIRETYGDHLAAIETSDEWRGLRATIDSFEDYVRIARLFAGSRDAVAEAWTELCGRLAATESRIHPPVVRRPNALNQSRLVLGTVQLGVPYGVANTTGRPDERVALSILDAARRAGVTHIDTARAYGDSERVIGRGLARGLSSDLDVVTKIHPLEEGATSANVVASVEASLRALSLDRVAALLVHRAIDWHREGVARALAQYQAGGVTRLIGASVGHPDELVDLLADDRVGYVQLPFNLLDRRWLQPGVIGAIRSRPEVVYSVRSVFLQGLLAARSEARWPLGYEADGADIVNRLDSLVRDFGRTSRADLAIAYVLGHDWVTSVVIGAETESQIRDTARLMDRPHLSPAEVSRVHEMVPMPTPGLLDPSSWTFA